MNHLIITVTVTVILGMVSGVPLMINKRDVTTTTEQDFVSSTSPHCSLPETTEEFPTFIFGYNVEDASELYTIKEAVEGCTDNSADVQSVTVAEYVNSIIFKMNRAAYLKACTNPAVKYAVYDGVVQGVIIANAVQSSTATATPTTAQPTIVDACQDVTAGKYHQIYSMKIVRPKSLVDKQARCEKMKRQLKIRNSIEGFWSQTCDQSCKTDGDTVTLYARLNEMSISYMCDKRGLNIPVSPERYSLSITMTPPPISC